MYIKEDVSLLGRTIPVLYDPDTHPRRNYVHIGSFCNVFDLVKETEMKAIRAAGISVSNLTVSTAHGTRVARCVEWSDLPRWMLWSRGNSNSELKALVASTLLPTESKAPPPLSVGSPKGAGHSLIFHLGVLYGSGAITEGGLQKILQVLAEEQVGEVSPTPLPPVQPAPLPEPPRPPPAPEPLHVLPEVQAAEQVGENAALAVVDVVPEGFLSAKAVAQVLESDWDHLLTRYVIQKSSRPKNKYTIHTLANRVGDLAREWMVHPLPSTGYVPPPSVDPRIARVHRTFDVKEEGARKISIVRDRRAVFGEEFVRMCVDRLTASLR